MAKNRKTKREKIRSTERVSQPVQKPLSTAASGDSNVFTFVSSTSRLSHTESIAATSHLREDLLRTGTVILAIIIAELVLFYTLAVR